MSCREEDVLVPVKMHDPQLMDYGDYSQVTTSCIKLSKYLI